MEHKTDIYILTGWSLRTVNKNNLSFVHSTITTTAAAAAAVATATTRTTKIFTTKDN